MNKDNFFGFRTDDDTAKSIKETLKDANKKFSEWIREDIEIKLGKKK